MCWLCWHPCDTWQFGSSLHENRLHHAIWGISSSAKEHWRLQALAECKDYESCEQSHWAEKETCRRRAEGGIGRILRFSVDDLSDNILVHAPESVPICDSRDHGVWCSSGPLHVCAFSGCRNCFNGLSLFYARIMANQIWVVFAITAMILEIMLRYVCPKNQMLS